MICTQCGLIDVDEEHIEMYICEECSTIFCADCIKRGKISCLNKPCDSENFSVMNSELNSLIFDLNWRHIKKGGFG